MHTKKNLQPPSFPCILGQDDPPMQPMFPIQNVTDCTKKLQGGNHTHIVFVSC